MTKFFFKKKNNKKVVHSQTGFTLIELMVSTSIFMVVMLIAMGSLIITSDAAKRSDALSFTMNNLSFAVESMSRSLRMGTNYTCPTGTYCNNGNSSFSSISFLPAKAPTSNIMTYKFNSNTKTIERCVNNNSCVDIVSPNIKINTLKFFVRGTDPKDGIQPSVYILLRGSVIIKAQQTSFAIQTMISQRTLE